MANVDKKSVGDRLIFIAVIISIITGLLLLSINIYGLTQPIRKPGLGTSDIDQLRFVPESVWTYRQSLAAIENLGTFGRPGRLAEEASQVVNQSLVHVKWFSVNPEEYRQTVPIWENYFLWAIGHFSGLPQFERYHYADYRRNIRRGIGMCGDASTALSSILDRYGVENQIVSFDGHVIVEYSLPGQDGRYLLDPDFGVSLQVSLEELAADPDIVRDQYQSAGYSTREVDNLVEVFRTDYALFSNTYEFMAKRYLFEDVSYVLKWVAPALLLFFPVLWLIWVRRFFRH